MADTPDDALIEAMARAILREQFPNVYARLRPTERDRAAARAAFAAVVVRLGLAEETQTRCTGCGSHWQGIHDRITNHFMHVDQPTEHVRERRLVSKWFEVPPAHCGAEQNTANLPENNPPHVCVRPPGHWPKTRHGDYQVPPFEWDEPEPRHQLVAP